MYLFAGKKYSTQEEFLEAMNLPIVGSEAVIEKLKEQGALKVSDEVMTPEEKLIERAKKEVAMDTMLEIGNIEDENKAKAKAEDRKENALVHDEIEVSFYTSKEADMVKKYAETKLFLEAYTRYDDGVYNLTIKNVSEMDMFNLKKVIAINNGSQALIGATSKIFETATGTTEFVAKNIVVPTAKIGINAGIKVLGTLAKATMATGGTIISSTTRGVEEIKQNIVEDKEVLEARQELQKVKNKLGGFFGKFASGSGQINIK